MGAMTMDPSDDAVCWVVISLVYMCPPAIDIITKTMSDMGLGMTLINNALPDVNFDAACTWHIDLVQPNMSHTLSFSGMY